MDLRALVESDLSDTLEGDFGLPVELKDPDGVTYTVSANDPESLLSGQVLWDHVEENLDTGAPVVVPRPVLVLRRSSLSRIPANGELWAVFIPETPNVDATKKMFLLSDPLEGGRSVGIIRFYLTEMEQS